MTDEQKLSYAIGYLRGISAILWNLDGEKRNVDFSCEDAADYDEQVDVLAKAILSKEDGE